MKIYFIRHGDPNYKDNCLTPLGHLQAEALAERWAASSEKVDRIYSSKYGRAVETAEHTAAKLGLPVEILDFMHEISTGRPDVTDEAEKERLSPWLGSGRYLEGGMNLASADPETLDLYAETRMMENDRRVVTGFDAWFAEQGYVREGLGYRCVRKNDETVLIFAHGGSISCLLGHFIGTNAVHACCFFRIRCTGICEVQFKGEEGEFVHPAFYSVADSAHAAEIKYTEPEN